MKDAINQEAWDAVDKAWQALIDDMRRDIEENKKLLERCDRDSSIAD